MVWSPGRALKELEVGAPPALQVPLAGNSLEIDAGARTECNRDLWVHEMGGSHKKKEAYRAWAEKKKVKSKYQLIYVNYDSVTMKR